MNSLVEKDILKCTYETSTKCFNGFLCHVSEPSKKVIALADFTIKKQAPKQSSSTSVPPPRALTSGRLWPHNLV